MSQSVEIPVDVVRTALAQVARTVRWPDGTLLIDVDLAVLEAQVAPALAEQLRQLLARPARGAA